MSPGKSFLSYLASQERLISGSWVGSQPLHGTKRFSGGQAPPSQRGLADPHLVNGSGSSSQGNSLSDPPPEQSWMSASLLSWGAQLVLPLISGGCFSTEAGASHYPAGDDGHCPGSADLAPGSVRLGGISHVRQFDSGGHLQTQSQLPYHTECTASRPISKVKRCWVRSLVGWVTVREHRILLVFQLLGTLGLNPC